MKKMVAFILRPIFLLARELIAVWHYVSDIFALLEILNLMSSHGPIEGLVIWLISSALSAFLAELLKSYLPTPLRILLRGLGI
jgi:hypothetical protein